MDGTHRPWEVSTGWGGENQSSRPRHQTRPSDASPRQAVSGLHLSQSEEWGGRTSVDDDSVGTGLAGELRSTRAHPHEWGGDQPRRSVHVPTHDDPVDEPPLHGMVTVTGQARGVERSPITETFGQRGTSHFVVSNFRIERYDANGNRLRPVAVVLKTRLADDVDINDGDQVRAYGNMKGGALHAKKVMNITTGAVAEARSNSRATMVGIMVALAILISMAVAFGTIAVIAYNNFERNRNETHQQWCEGGHNHGFDLPGC